MDTIYFIFYVGMTTQVVKLIMNKAGKESFDEAIDTAGIVVVLTKVIPMIREVFRSVQDFARF